MKPSIIMDTLHGLFPRVTQPMNVIPLNITGHFNKTDSHNVHITPPERAAMDEGANALLQMTPVATWLSRSALLFPGVIIMVLIIFCVRKKVWVHEALRRLSDFVHRQTGPVPDSSVIDPSKSDMVYLTGSEMLLNNKQTLQDDYHGYHNAPLLEPARGCGQDPSGGHSPDSSDTQIATLIDPTGRNHGYTVQEQTIPTGGVAYFAATDGIATKLDLRSSPPTPHWRPCQPTPDQVNTNLTCLPPPLFGYHGNSFPPLDPHASSKIQTEKGSFPNIPAKC